MKSIKRMMSSLVLGTMVLSSGMMAFADTTPQPVLISSEVTVQPILISAETISETKYMFDVKYDGNQFSITLDENPSTGYSWVYTLKDSDLVKFISDEYIAPETSMPGAGGKHVYTFEILEDGVTTIDFEYKQTWDGGSSDGTLNLLAYKNGETVIVEENGIVTISEEDKTMVEAPAMNLMFGEKAIELDVQIQEIDGVTMVPAALILREMGYEVTWKAETNSVDIMKGAQFTTLYIDKNSYFKNKMAARPLSAAPVVVDGRTLVPVEFFHEILGLGIDTKDQSITINEYQMVTHSGYVKEITKDENGIKQITIVQDLEKDDINEMTVINVSSEHTIYNKEVKEGDMIHAVCGMMMTMSIPPQTPGYIIY